MGKLFMGSRSSLGTTVIMMDEDGPAKPIKSVWRQFEGNRRLPLEWGWQAESTFPLAYTLVLHALGGSTSFSEENLKPLCERLKACNSDVWVLTEEEALAGLGSIL